LQAPSESIQEFVVQFLYKVTLLNHTKSAETYEPHASSDLSFEMIAAMEMVCLNDGK
jgi:hypothetical protein